MKCKKCGKGMSQDMGYDLMQNIEKYECHKCGEIIYIERELTLGKINKNIEYIKEKSTQSIRDFLYPVNDKIYNLAQKILGKK